MLTVKRILFFLIFTIFCFKLSAHQEVPNVIMTDIQGNERNLYQSLDEGKVVIVEVFATWCTTCWENFNQHSLQNIYNTYGPNGTQQLEIFFIEGDLDTGDEELYGNGSLGDWTDGISYPIFNPTQLDDEFLEIFAPDGVPTSNVICPMNKEIIADIYQNELSEIIEIIQACNTISDVTDLQIIKPSESDLAICKPTDLIINVLNTGTEEVTSLALDARFEDGTIFSTHNCVVSMHPGLSYPVDLGAFEILDNLETQIIDLNIAVTDDVPTNNMQRFEFKHAESVSDKLQLKIKTDRWVELDNTRWWIENSAGEIAAPVNYLINDTIVMTEIFVDYHDCFTFIIEDDYGDGFVLGEIELKTADGTIIFDNTNFQFRGEANFEFTGTVSSSSLGDIDDGYDLSMTTNLLHTEAEVQIQLPKVEDVNLRVIEPGGRIMISRDIASADTQFLSLLNVQDLQQGIYFLQLTTEQGILTQKFIKQ